MYKYKVLVADDEYWSRVTLQNLAPWEDYQIQFLEPACDGREVLDRIPKEQPDIVITDINMPFVDGLQLLNSINDNHSDIVTIAVSGYDDFEKVKGTFKAGGIDYLLKPVGRDQLKEVIEKALDKLEDKNTKKQDEIKTNRELELADSAITDSKGSAVLTAELYGGTADYSSEIDQKLSMLIKFHDIDGLSKKYSFKMHEMSFDIKQKIALAIKNLRPNMNPYIFCYSPKVNEFLVCMDTDTPFLKRAANEILMEFGIDKNGPVTVVIKKNEDQTKALGQAYREMIASLMTRSFVEKQCIITVDGAKDIESVKKVSAIQEKNIRDAIEKGRLKDLRRLVLEDTGISSCDDGTWTLYEIGQLTAQLFSIIVPAKGFTEETLDIRDEIIDSIRYDRLKLSKEALVSDLEILCNLTCQEKTEKLNGSIEEMAEKIHAKIEKSFNEHITLSTLAEEFFVDPSYISRTFSKKYGETIMGFVTRMRMEKAIALIEEGKNTLEEISFVVGYDDYNYFSRVFKKQTGFRPSEYKAINKVQGENA